MNSKNAVNAIIQMKIKIALAVSSEGDWAASGWSGISDEESMELCLDGITGSITTHWIEVNVPVPNESIMEGRMTK